MYITNTNLQKLQSISFKVYQLYEWKKAKEGKRRQKKAQSNKIFAQVYWCFVKKSYSSSFSSESSSRSCV